MPPCVLESAPVEGIPVAKVFDLIYLDKGADTADYFPDTWKYYRVTGVMGLGNTQGTEGATIQVCRVSWPKFEDIPPINDSPGVTTYASAWEIVNGALRQWDIDRERSIIIGLRPREE
jgi:hypothetical protein